MDDIIKPRIDLKQQETISCEKCESNFFSLLQLFRFTHEKRPDL